MRNLFFNKKGNLGEKIFIFWWVVMLIIVAIGIVASVAFFNSTKLDLREVEAGLLHDKIVNCISENGFLKQEIYEGISKEVFDFSNYCAIDLEISGEDEHYFYVKVLDFPEEIEKSFFQYGNTGFNLHCQNWFALDKSGREDSSGFPRCFYSSEVFLFENNGNQEKINLEILTASNAI